MSANKKRRRLPEEDLAATVADIISSPITRSNLSFLRPLPALPVEPGEAELINRDSEPQRDDGKLPADSLEPLGDTSTPMGAEELSRSGLYSQLHGKPVPDGDTSHLSAYESVPQDLNTHLPIHSWQPVNPTRMLWQAEGLGTFFEQTRVRRIHQAQDALSLVEEKVYDLLWGPKNQRKDEFRLVHYSLQRIATEARINIKTVRELIPRLIDKGFIAIAHEADVRRNIPTLYQVSSYSSVLNDQKRRQRSYVAKTGKGVFYVHPISAFVEAASEPMGLELQPDGVTPIGVWASPLGNTSSPPGAAPTGPMGPSALKPMGARGHPSIDILIDTFLRQTTATTYAAMTESITEALGLKPDENLLRTMICACHKNAFDTVQGPATDEELIYFATTKARVLSRASNIRNHLAVLRKAVPECFLGESFRAYRAASLARRQKAAEHEQYAERERVGREREAAEAEARYALWVTISERHKRERGYDMRAIATDPELDDLGKQQAQGMLERLGRFTRSGL